MCFMLCAFMQRHALQMLFDDILRQCFGTVVDDSSELRQLCALYNVLSSKTSRIRL